jgi:hypothetical protein
MFMKDLSQIFTETSFIKAPHWKYLKWLWIVTKLCSKVLLNAAESQEKKCEVVGESDCWVAEGNFSKSSCFH